MVEIKIIKDTEHCKVGQIVESSKKSAESTVNAGYAVYVNKIKTKKQPSKGVRKGRPKLRKPKTEIKSPTAKSIIDIFNKIKVKFNIDIPGTEIKEGSILEYKESEAKNLVKNGIASFYDIEDQREYDNDESIAFALKAYVDKREMADNFIQRQPIFYDKSGMFWLWRNKEKMWEMIDETDLMNKIDSSGVSGVDTIQSKHKQEILESLKRVGRNHVPEPLKKTWVQFNDKVVDVISGETFDATHKYHITNPIPWKIGKTSQTPTMDKIFKEWVGEDYVQVLYEIIAYSTLPDYPIHRIFCFVGAGLNGKSKYLELVEKFLGSNNVTNTELDTLLSSRFEMCKLYKKLACMMGETDYNSMKKTSLIKRLSDGSPIGYEFKNKTPFDSKTYTKILIATNGLPQTEDKSVGFYRRWMIIDFPNTFSEKKDILSEIPEEEYENLANKCIIILKNLLSVREFTNEGSLEDRKIRYEDVSNPLQKFIDEFTKRSHSGKIPKWEFKDKFVSWMISRGYRQWSDTEIGINMKALGTEEKKMSVDEKRWMCWLGIDWKKKSVQSVQSVQGVSTYFSHGKSKSKGVDTLDTLDNWRKSGDRNSELTIDFLKNTYEITEKELMEHKKNGMVMEVTPNKFKIV